MPGKVNNKKVVAKVKQQPIQKIKPKIKQKPQVTIDPAVKRAFNGFLNPMEQGRLPSDEPNFESGCVQYEWTVNFTSSGGRYLGVAINPGLSNSLGILDVTEDEAIFTGGNYSAAADALTGYPVSVNFPMSNGEVVRVPSLKSVSSRGYYDANGKWTLGAVWAFLPDDLNFTPGNILTVTTYARGSYGNFRLKVATSTGGVIATTTLISVGSTTASSTANVPSGVMDTLIGEIATSDFWWFETICNTEAFDNDIGVEVPVLLQGSLTAPGGESWRFYDYGQVINDDGSATPGPIYEAIQTLLRSYDQHRINAHLCIVSNTASGDAAGGTLNAVITKSGTRLSSYGNARALMNAINEYPGPHSDHNDAKRGLAARYAFDAPYLWGFRENSYPLLSEHEAFKTAQDMYYPKTFVVFKNAPIPNGIGFYPTQLSLRFQVSIEFTGRELILEMRFVDAGLTQLRMLYGAFIRECFQSIGENPDHIRKAARTLMNLSQNEAVRFGAKMLWHLTKAGIAAVAL